MAWPPHEQQAHADRGDAHHGQRAPRVVLDRLPRLAEAALLLLLADRVVLLDAHRLQTARIEMVDGVQESVGVGAGRAGTTQHGEERIGRENSRVAGS